MKQYFCHLVYFATGEGRVVSFTFIFADSEENAKVKFLNLTVCQKSIGQDFHEKSLDYFKQGVYIWEVKDENWVEIRRYLNDYLSPKMAEILEKNVKDQGQIDFFFHSYCNFS